MLLGETGPEWERKTEARRSAGHDRCRVSGLPAGELLSVCGMGFSRVDACKVKRPEAWMAAKAMLDVHFSEPCMQARADLGDKAHWNA